jgi:hypothetical protein
MREPQSYSRIACSFASLKVAESNFRVARKNVGEKPGTQLWRVKAHEPGILRGEYIPIGGSVKAFFAKIWTRMQIIDCLG